MGDEGGGLGPELLGVRGVGVEILTSKAWGLNLLGWSESRVLEYRWSEDLRIPASVSDTRGLCSRMPSPPQLMVTGALWAPERRRASGTFSWRKELPRPGEKVQGGPSKRSTNSGAW